MSARLRLGFASVIVLLGASGLFTACGDETESTPAYEKCPAGFLDCGEFCADARSGSSCGACDNVCRGDQVCHDGACGCPDDDIDCDGRCIDPTDDPNHCGSCDTICGEGSLCYLGECLQLCTTCGTETCIDTQQDPEHCGDCDTRCGEGEVCALGRCGVDCPSAFRLELCDGICTNTETDSDHCGDCDTACAPFEQCDGGECTDPCESLGSSYERCGSACTDVDEDPLNCGACDVVCEADEDCRFGVCIPKCGPGSILCDGYCREYSGTNCGACDRQCPSDEYCTVTEGVGSCVTICDYVQSGTTHCDDGACHDLLTDEAHCGDCDVACSGAETCFNGACQCNADVCDGECTDLDADPEHCGDCDIACQPGESCVDGACGCPGGGALCDGECVDLDTDEDNCGACAFPCDAGQACLGGVCECPGDETSCSGVCRDLQRDDANCGGCGVICPATLSCVNGTCRQELTCEQNFTEPSGCAVFPVDAAACGTPVLAETTSWGGANISSTLFFEPGVPWTRGELIRISGQTDAPDACCGGGVVSLGFQSSDDRTQTWTQFISPNDGINHAVVSIEEVGSAFDCSQPDHAFFGSTGNYAFQVERFAMSGDFNGGGTSLADAVPLAIGGDGAVCAQVCGVHKAQCAGEQRQFYKATIPPHRALAIDYGAKGNGTVEALEVYTPSGELVCNAVGAVSAPTGYVFFGSRVSNHTDVPREVVLAPVAIFASSYFNIAVGLEDDPIP